jgi:nucleotide sugar dehydrogenase
MTQDYRFENMRVICQRCGRTGMVNLFEPPRERNFVRKMSMASGFYGKKWWISVPDWWVCKDCLINDPIKIAVFGTGYIGFSTMAWLSKTNTMCYGIDIDQEKVDAINRGKIPVDGIAPLLPDGGFNPNLVSATTHWKTIVERDDIDAFFIAVPTERDGNPWWDPLKDVISKLNTCKSEPLIIVESTLAVGTVDCLFPPELKRNVAVCPRRDWFTEASKNLKSLPRIVGGVSEEVTRNAVKLLSRICNELIPCSYHEAELVKAYENSFRHVTCVLAQEMALAYPHIDVRRVLELAGTKWNVEAMFPNPYGTGGYCVPLSSRYVFDGAQNPSELTLIQDTIQRDNSIVEIFGSLNRFNRIACLGLSYIGNIKVHVLSPLIRLLKVLSRSSIKVHDPLYTDEEIKSITGCDAFMFPDNLGDFEVILLLADHDEYRDVDVSQLVQNTEHCKFIFDNTGLWKDIAFKCPYYLSGQAGWMEFQAID